MILLGCRLGADILYVFALQILFDAGSPRPCYLLADDETAILISILVARGNSSGGYLQARGLAAAELQSLSSLRFTSSTEYDRLCGGSVGLRALDERITETDARYTSSHSTLTSGSIYEAL